MGNDSSGKHDQDRSKSRNSDKHGLTLHGHDSRHSHARAENFKNEDNRHSRKERNKAEDGLIISESFLVDRKGDPGILQFGSNHTYGIPIYRRTGGGRIVGLPLSLKIDREKTSNKEIHLISPDPPPSKRNKSLYAKVANQDEYRVHAARTTFDDDLGKNYLKLHAKQQTDPEVSGSDSDESGEHLSIHYRSITGKATHGHPNDEDLELERSTPIPTIREKDVDQELLQNKVDRDPTNAQTWLELIQHKFRNASNESYAERASNAEIKIAMYEKALKHVKANDQDLLFPCLLREAALIWDSQRLQRKWKDILKQYPRSFNLRKDYLDYVQTTSVRFRFDDLRNIYQDCIRDFKTALTKEVPHMQRRFQIRQLLYFLARWTRCLQEAGFPEQAVAIWQTILEVQLSHSSRTEDQFELFWEAEALRIGEVNAPGIDHWTQTRGEAPAETIDLTRPKQGTVGGWLIYENTMMKQLPARTLDSTDDEDPFRVVLFPDIQPFWLELPRDEIRVVLDAFLIFCGLPPIQEYTTDLNSNDIFLHLWASDGFQQGTTTHIHAQGQFSSCLLTNDVLFANSDSLFSKSTISVEPDFVRRVFRFCVEQDSKLEQSGVAQYYLALELKFNSNQVRKISKNLLKKHSQNMSLYNTHALIEYRLGNRSAAQNILSTAISMRPNDPEVILLKRTLVWEALEAKDHNAALAHLLGDSKEQDAMAIFTIQQEFLQTRDKVAQEETTDHLSLAYIECLVLLTYLTNNEPLNAALAIFDSNITFLQQRLPNRSQYIQMLHQSLARLLQYHIKNYSYKPSTVRQAVQKSIDAFPMNTIFLSLLRANEQRFRIHDRVRSVVSDILKGHAALPSATLSSPLIAHLFAIEAELSRSAVLGSSTNAIRSSLERAVQDPYTRSSPALWHSYIEFEYSQQATHDSRLGDVLLRSIAACPWVRKFHLRAMQYWIEIGNMMEARGIYELMVERELRVHMLLADDVWSGSSVVT